VVTRVGTRPIAALIAAVVLAALFAACGGSSSDSSSTTSEASSATAPDTAAQSGSQGNSSQRSPAKNGDQSQNSDQGQGGGQTQQDSGSRGKSVEEVETPLKVSGGGSAQFRTKGGDNSVQEFGDEGDESELQEAAEIVHGFYVSRAAEEWDKACSYLAKANIEQLEQLGSQSPQFKNAGCAPILKAFTRPVPASVNREITTVDAGSLRHEGEQGFLIYHGAGNVTYAMPLRDEGGTWKVAALSGTTLG
jgi:hypothetical protein